MTYDKTKTYPIPFIGGPCDGKTFPLVPADRLVWEQKAQTGLLVKRHIYDLREGVDPNTGNVLKLEYHYSP